MKILNPKPRKRTSKSTPKSNQSQAKLIQSTISLVEEKGFEAVSLREICAHSKQNLASVSYHFGNKDSLFDTIIHGYYADMINQWASNLKSCLEETDNKPSAKQILASLIKPYIFLVPNGTTLRLHRAMFVQSLMHSAAEGPLSSPKVKKVLDLYVATLVASQPQLTRKQANRLIRLSLGATINTLVLESDPDLESTGPMSSKSLNNTLDRLSSFCASHISQEGTL